jgi:hypothetical protein
MQRSVNGVITNLILEKLPGETAKILVTVFLNSIYTFNINIKLAIFFSIVITHLFHPVKIAN